MHTCKDVVKWHEQREMEYMYQYISESLHLCVCEPVREEKEKRWGHLAFPFHFRQFPPTPTTQRLLPLKMFYDSLRVMNLLMP